MRSPPPPGHARRTAGRPLVRDASVVAMALAGLAVAALAGASPTATGAPVAVLASRGAAQLTTATLTGRISDGRALPLAAAVSPMDVRIEHCGPVLRSWWRNPDGALLAADELVVESDGGFASYRYWLPGVAETVAVHRAGNRARVELRRGEQRTVREIDVPEDVLVGPMLVPRAQALAAGTGAPRMTVPYLVPDRFRVIEFELGVVPGAAPTTVRIAANSALVRAFVDPLTVGLDGEGRFMRLQGRALPAKGTPGRKQPLVVDLVIESRHEASCSAAPLARAPD